MTQKTNENPWTMDVRVRERNLKSGALTDKDLEKFLAALPDLADQVEPFATSQPALAQPQHVAVVEPAPVEVVAEAPAVEEVKEEVVAAPQAPQALQEPQTPREPQASLDAPAAPQEPQASQELPAPEVPQTPQEPQPPAVEASSTGEGELS